MIVKKGDKRLLSKRATFRPTPQYECSNDFRQILQVYKTPSKNKTIRLTVISVTCLLLKVLINTTFRPIQSLQSVLSIQITECNIQP